MSNYPCGCPSGHYTPVEMNCKDCDHWWEAEGYWDLGMTDLVNERDSQCPNCESWNTQ